MRIHASCAARPGPEGFDGVLLLGRPGSGKSDLLLRLLARGWHLVADDQVLVEHHHGHHHCAAPAALAGLIEVRGLGIFRRPCVKAARLRLAVRLGLQPERLPAPLRHEGFDVPEIMIDPAQASAPERVALAFDAVMGLAEHSVGAFAA